MNPSISAPVWFITGCSRGLGRALAIRVLKRGHQLVSTARQPASLDDLVALGAGRCRALALDVANPAKAAAAIVAVAEAENPPLRLVLGKYAQDKARRKIGSSARERESWGAAGAATDFDAAL